jgi:hypothetical protein
MALAQGVRFDAYLNPTSYHQEQHRRSMSTVLSEMDFLVLQLALVA